MNNLKPDTIALVIAAREIAYDFAVQDAMGKERADALDKALEPFAGQVGWDDESAALDLTSESEAAKPCTCHLDDNPPVPSAQKYALSECLSAPQPAQLDLEVVAWRCFDVIMRSYNLTDDADHAGLRGRSDQWVVEPLVRLTDAQAHISALTAKVEELTREIGDWKHGHEKSVRAHAEALSRAETAEARVAQLEEALEFYGDVSKYPAPLTGGMGALWEDCGQIARAALGGQSNET